MSRELLRLANRQADDGDEPEEDSSAGSGPLRFLGSVREEMSRVSWMSPRELAMSTGVVVASVAAAVAMLWAYDAVLSRLLRLILR